MMRRIRALATPALLLILIGSITAWALYFLKPVSLPVAALVTQPAEVTPSLAVAADLFGRADGATAAVNIELRGVILGNPHAASIAIVIPEGGTVREVKTGDQVMEGVIIKEIHNQHIILLDHGVSRMVGLRELEPPETKSADRSPKTPAPPSGRLDGSSPAKP